MSWKHKTRRHNAGGMHDVQKVSKCLVFLNLLIFFLPIYSQTMYFDW